MGQVGSFSTTNGQVYGSYTNNFKASFTGVQVEGVFTAKRGVRNLAEISSGVDIRSVTRNKDVYLTKVKGTLAIDPIQKRLNSLELSSLTLRAKDLTFFRSRLKLSTSGFEAELGIGRYFALGGGLSDDYVIAGITERGIFLGANITHNNFTGEGLLTFGSTPIDPGFGFKLALSFQKFGLALQLGGGIKDKLVLATPFGLLEIPFFN